jgi:benzylsuccinate CoA-transferase BbsF subunit
MADGALAGIRVIELGDMVAAPYCARLFADQGADVIKIERPGTGDVTRSWGPFPNDAPDIEKSGLYFFLNTSKRSVTLDVTTPSGREQLLGLLRGADVFIEGHRPDQMRAWGFDYESIAKANPGLVMISLTPFGQTGPYASWNAYDLNAYHLTGTGHRYCGRPGEAPLEHGTFSADFFGAIAGAAWGMAAVYGRDKVGGGQHLDVSCAETIAALLTGCQNIGAYAQDGEWNSRTGIGMRLGAPATILPTKDGHVWMLALEAGQWNGLAEVMGNPDWMLLEQFQDMFVRAQNAEAMYPLITQWTVEHGKLEIMDRCQAAGCPTTAVFSMREAAEHPHLRERGYIVEVEHPRLGKVRDMRAPFQLADGGTPPTRPAPLLGQHNDEVLNETPASEAEGFIPQRTAIPQRQAPTLPLSSIRVANFGWVWAGPVAGQTLAFLGAEVYKIESRARVDLNRTLPPFAEGVRDPDRSLQNHAAWAGNGSVSLNLRKPEARELALKLVAQCDVAIENFGPNAMDSLGLGYDALRTVRPDIVMVSMPAAGLHGPLRDVRTYGLSLSSLTGLDSLTGYVGGGPVPMENAYSDPFNGVFAAFAAVAALRQRDMTGKGQHVDFSQQEAMMQMTAPAFMDYVLNGRVGGPLGNRHSRGVGAPHGVFRCAALDGSDDRWISIAVLTDDEWLGLVEAMDNPSWAAAPEFVDGLSRVANIDALHERIEAWTRDQDDYALAAKLQENGVAAAPVLSVADLLHDPHYKARETFIEVTHPLGFRETIYGSYVKMSRSEPAIRPGPAIGGDNDHVFRELLGLPDAEYQRLIADEVIY